MPRLARLAAKLMPPLVSVVVAAVLVGAAVGITAVLGAAVAIAQPAPATASAGSPAAAVRRAEIRVLPRAEVAGAEFTLGEVAELDGSDMALVRQLAAVALGRSPLPGRTQRLSEAYIRARVGQVIDNVDVTVIVPPGAMVELAAQTIAGEDIAARVLAQAAEEAVASGQEVEQELATPIADAVVPRGDVTWEIEAQGQRLSAGGARTYRVAAKVNGVEVWRAMARVNQQVFRTVVVAQHSVRRNQVLRAEDVALVRKSIVGMKEEAYLTGLAEVVGSRAKRPIGRGEWVHKGLIVARTDVPEGGPVTLVFRTEQMLFSTPGVALVPAKVGEFIPVRNLESGRIVYGVVQANETVKVN